MSSGPELLLDWCSHEAARYAVEHWHYSKTMPVNKLVKIGVWEDGQFIGAILFGTGAAANIAKTFNLKSTQICELVRVAFKCHKNPTSRILAIAIRLLRRRCPSLSLVVSYADPDWNHVGIIYQADNWIYVGESSRHWTVNGQHNRIFGSRKDKVIAKYGETAVFRKGLAKHKYVYILNTNHVELVNCVMALRKPYPKRLKDSSEPSSLRLEEGGAAPTRTLQNHWRVKRAKKGGRA